MIKRLFGRPGNKTRRTDSQHTYIIHNRVQLTLPRVGIGNDPLHSDIVELGDAVVGYLRLLTLLLESVLLQFLIQTRHVIRELQLAHLMSEIRLVEQI